VVAPIEPAAITAAALLATKALEALGGKAGEITWAGMSRLVALIRSRVAGHRRAETALARLERHPDGHEHVRELAELLTTFAAQDAGFHRDLVALVADARRDPTIGSLAAQVYGQAQVGQLFTIGQMRDVHFHAAPASRLVSAAPPQPIEVRWPTLGGMT
jgi:hypothetical protein